MSPTTFPELEESLETPAATKPDSQRKLDLQGRGALEGEQNTGKKQPEAKPSHAARMQRKPRTSYIAPSRVNTVSVIVPLEPELKKAVDDAVEQTGMSQKDFLTAAIKRAVEGHTTETDPITAKMTEEALEKTHELEFLIRRVNRSLTTRTRS